MFNLGRGEYSNTRLRSNVWKQADICKMFTLFKNFADLCGGSIFANSISYIAYIQPSIDYAVSVWASCSEQPKDLICRLQRRAAHITGSSDFINRVADLVKDLGLQTLLNTRRDYFLSTLVYKWIKGNAPVRLINELIMTADTHDCNTRALLVWFYKSPSPPQNFLGTRLDIKGLHCELACHPISKMSRMLIISSASIRSSSWNDLMSGISNICMFQKPVVVPICSGFYRLFVLRALRWFMRFIRHLVLKYTCWERVRHSSVLVTHVWLKVFYSVLVLRFCQL